jgi:hypothetical protein
VVLVLVLVVAGGGGQDLLLAGLAIKNPHKKTLKNPPKKRTKMVFFLNFLKIIQTFLFETDF